MNRFLPQIWHKSFKNHKNDAQTIKKGINLPHAVEVTPIISLLWDADIRASIFLAYPGGQNLKLGCFKVGEIRSWWSLFGPDPSPTSRYECICHQEAIFRS